jgi:hypothetical protein
MAMKTNVLLVASLVGLGACAMGGNAPRTAAAGGITADLAREFERMDANRDGFISREEARADAQVTRQFDQADANRDGRLEPSEFKVAPPTGYKAGN